MFKILSSGQYYLLAAYTDLEQNYSNFSVLPTNVGHIYRGDNNLFSEFSKKAIIHNFVLQKVLLRAAGYFLKNLVKMPFG